MMRTFFFLYNMLCPLKQRDNIFEEINIEGRDRGRWAMITEIINDIGHTDQIIYLPWGKTINSKERLASPAWLEARASYIPLSCSINSLSIILSSIRMT